MQFPPITIFVMAFDWRKPRHRYKSRNINFSTYNNWLDRELCNNGIDRELCNNGIDHEICSAAWKEREPRWAVSHQCIRQVFAVQYPTSVSDIHWWDKG